MNSTPSFQKVAVRPEGQINKIIYNGKHDKDVLDVNDDDDDDDSGGGG